eukprot:CAMPEP_0172470944 /NCGR_PEP_ID=MMETSP1065-20121228/67556_1 /TAXON_ID=265537 /ORGANISM="Amphiprora paludosa, Strain CCMP125" /LENGTH=663 /DNA_ID=CAMNT_0013229021 /DNA_START=434 /DNA_END=2425 /DNA_ORIENTATION=+
MKIIQLQTTDGLQKRVIRSTQNLRDWLEELGAPSSSYVLDANNVQRTDLEDLDENVVYSLAAFSPSRKRKRVSSELSSSTLAELIHSRSFDEAWQALEKLSRHYLGDGNETHDTICNPLKISRTWKGKDGALVKSLRDVCDEVKKSIQYPKDGRAGRVVGIRLGSGCGKSHLLLEAPRILQQHGIYITYNLDQLLTFDCQDGSKAVLLRTLLRLAKLPNKMCPRFIGSEAGQLLMKLDTLLLRAFVVHQLGMIESSIFIGVDEIMELQHQLVVKAVLSELGEVAVNCYHHNNHQQCNVFVSSLKEEPFSTASGRRIFRWSPPVPDESAAELILQPYTHDRDLNRCKVLAISAAGFHFRSLVFAAQAIAQDMAPSVQSILNSVIHRWRERVPESLFAAMRDYVLDSCRGLPLHRQSVQVHAMLESYLDEKLSLPPPLILGAFGVANAGNEEVDGASPLFGLFNCDFAYTDPAKHLEQFGLHFDIFRHSHDLSVLSSEVHVAVRGVKKDPAWYQNLKYPSELRTSGEALFCLRNREVTLTEQGEVPTRKNYYAPRVANHPLIDRAFIAMHPLSGDECFVLIQDKVNKDVSKAVEDLNSAARLIKGKHPSMEVLCIVNVIGATSNTAAQDNLEYSHVLVREDELDAFYSVNFAPVARFARLRHELG